ncbi:MAG: hypothetical protein RLZZ135_179 [Cyanobacteriota bacterium]
MLSIALEYLPLTAMSDLKPRPPALIAIVIYKCFTVGLLVCVAIGLFLTSKKYDDLYGLANEYMMTGKREIIKSALAEILTVSTTKMQLGAIVALIYAAVNGLEAIGLWHQKAWATILVVGIVGLTIPVEIYEIIHKASVIKFGVFAINIAMFVYLLRHALEERKKHQRSVH